MDKRKYLDGLFKRINYLATMASSEEPDYDALSIEYNEITKKIKELSLIIKAYTPTKADLDSAKNKDRIRLSSKKEELAEFENELEEKIDALNQENDKLIEIIAKIDDINKKISNLESEDKTISKHKQLSREFKQFVTSYREDIQNLKKDLSELIASKTRSQNSISVYNEEKEQLEDKIKSLKTDIKIIEGNLKTEKAYENTGIIREKKLIIDNYNRELDNLNARKEKIENNPIYLAAQMKELLEAGKDKTKVSNMLSNIYEQAQSQPYMSIVIRGGDTKKLVEEYEIKKLEKEELEKRINKTDYSLKVLPIEESRQNSIEKLINLYKTKISDYENSIKQNNIAISSLAGTVKTLIDKYNENETNVKKFAEDLSNIIDTTELAHKKHEHEKMENVLENEQSVIAALKTDIADLIQQNEDLETKITELEAKIASFTKESSEILNRQMSRNNYYDIIRKNSDESQLNAVKRDIHYILKRSKYRHYNIANLYADISQGIKTIYTPKEKIVKKTNKPKKTTKYILEPVTLKKEKEPIKQSSPVEKTMTLNQLLDNSKEINKKETNNKEIVTKEDIHESISQLEKTMEQLFPKTQQENFELPIDVASIVKNQQVKQENDSVELGLNELSTLADSIQANISSALKYDKPEENVSISSNLEEKNIKNSDKIKVIDIKSLNPVKENINPEKNEKIKVINISKINKNDKNDHQTLEGDIFAPFDNNQEMLSQEENVISYKRAA